MFTDLGTFDKSIGPDKLVFVRQPGQTQQGHIWQPEATSRSKEAARLPQTSPLQDRPPTARRRRDIGISVDKEQTTLPTDGTPAYKPATDADGNIMLPKASSGTLTGRWIATAD